MKNITLITGGTKSGKSLQAENLALSFELPTYYLATMTENNLDEEQVARIAKHRKRRPAHWQTIEVSDDAPKVILSLPKEKACVLFDCLSLFVSKLVFSSVRQETMSLAVLESLEKNVQDKINKLIAAMEARLDLNFIVVTSEVGWSVVPEMVAGRIFRDILGDCNQCFAQVADHVLLCCMGLSIKIK